VLLLDEIEKAHPDIFNILLQVMDHGKLTDHNGKQVDFRNVVLIMTTNAGATEMAKAAMGFGKSKRTGDDEEAINRLFTPEFRNRLDAIIAFDSLPPQIVHRVVEKFVLQLEAQLADRGVTFDLDEQATAWLAEKGYDERMGARPLGRLIQEVIKRPIADEVLFGKLQKGGIVKVSVEAKPEGGTGLKLECIPDENATRKERPLNASGGGDGEGGQAPPKPRTRPKKPKGGGSVPRVPLRV
jgi:ATP-dependent Clp protease ATP-binding subunit ClpA